MLNRSLTRGSKAAGRWLTFFLLSCLAILLTGTVARAQEEGVLQTGNYPKTVDPWEVILYWHPNFAGSWVSYKIGPGMRQRVVPVIHPAMEDQVSSIQVGEKVNVVVFSDRDFHAGSIGSSFGLSNLEPGELGGSKDLGGSVAKLEDYRNDKISSLIIYPKAAKLPLGVWLWDDRQNSIKEMTFFPLHELEGVLEYGYGFLGKVNLDKNANVIGNPGRSRSLGSVTTSAWADNIQVILYEERNYQGTPLPFPGAAGWGGSKDYDLGLFGWSDRAASLRVRWTGPPLALGPPLLKFTTEQNVNLPGKDYRNFYVDGEFRECEKVCAAEQPNCKAYTWIKPGVQGPKAVCWLKSSKPAEMVTDANCVSGWIGVKPSMSVKVNAPPADAPPGPTQPQPPKQRNADITGQWQSNTGAVYDIKWSTLFKKDAGDFTWSVAATGEQGSATVQGNSISASWKGAAGTGSAKGAVSVETPGGLATRMEWGNGVVFTRRAGVVTPKPSEALLGGTWQSNIGLVYEITQTDGQFTWAVAGIGQTGKGTLTGDSITASWSDAGGTGSAKGKVTKVDAQGRATEIKWENGVIFFR